MWLSSIVSSTLFVMAMSQGAEYLPPNKGYNYEPPSIPFNPNQNVNKQPTPPPVRPPPPTSRPSYLPPSPTPGPAPTPHHEHHEHHDHDHHHEPGMPFDFSYQVAEDGNDYSHNAISDGDVTKGEYRVALPDGRTQIVKYTADWKNGFNAEHHEHHEHHDHDHHHEHGMPFDFFYQVAEDGNDYCHNAISDGDVTKGEYRVALPDGRTQIVKYTADWKNGFNAEVTYEGEARYPDPPAGGYGSGSSGGYSGGSSSGSTGGGQQYVPPSQGGGYQY